MGAMTHDAQSFSSSHGVGCDSSCCTVCHATQPSSSSSFTSKKRTLSFSSSDSDTEEAVASALRGSAAATHSWGFAHARRSRGSPLKQQAWKPDLAPARPATARSVAPHLQSMARLVPQQHLSSQQAWAGLVRSGGNGGGGGGGGSIVTALDFSPDGALLAAGSTSKQVCLYALPEFPEPEHQPCPSAGASGSRPRHQPTCSWDSSDRNSSIANPAASGGCDSLIVTAAAVHSCPGKVGCLAWDPDADGVVTIGDYDGVLHQVHLPSGHHVTELDAHAGRRVWSVSHSRLRRHLCVSASDDGAARLWSGRGLACEAMCIRPAAAAAGAGGTFGNVSVCCAEFSPWDENLLALACADGGVYVYDLRAAAQGPLRLLGRHAGRPAAYARFASPAGLLASSSTDGTVAVWDLHGAAGVQQQGATAGGGLAGCSDGAPRRVLRGHANAKNFVGLSALTTADGGCCGGPGKQRPLLACGSETGEVFVYDVLSGCGGGTEAEGGPLASAPVCGSSSASGGLSTEGQARGWVSSVCWRPMPSEAGASAAPVLAAGTCGGEVALLALQGRPAGHDACHQQCHCCQE